MPIRFVIFVRVVVGFRFAKFGQHPAGTLGVKKGDLLMMRPAARRFVDQPDARFLKLGQPRGEIIDGVGDVVEAFASLFEEAGDG